MKINPILIKLPIKFGLFGLLLTVLSFLVFYYTGLQPWRNLISLILDTLLVGAFCFVAIREFKWNYNGGILSFFHGMTLGFVTYIIIALGFGLFYRLFIDVVEPDFMSNYIALAKEDMISRKTLIVASLGEESYDKNFTALDTTSSSVLMLDAIIKKALIGLFLTPIFSVIMRTHHAK
jgi:uncharacterized protein DUF4199